MSKKLLMLFCLLVSVCAQGAGNFLAADIAKHRAAFTNNNSGEEGIKFVCSASQLTDIDHQMSDYFDRLGIPSSFFVRHLNPQQESLIYTLTTPTTDVATLDFYLRSEMDIHDQVVPFPSERGTISTVSEKEIVLALMQHGRLTEFTGEQCNAPAFIDHVKIRQNTVAWAESLNWEWPDGGKAKWNTRYWKKGTPLHDVTPSVAVADAFEHQKKYAIGCYTATKLVMVQGILDYYNRIKQSEADVAKIERRLMTDGEPLQDLEPPGFWSFEADFDKNELWKKGKLLEMRYNIPAQNVVPGDWIYIRNTDRKTESKVGYEGSNAIYLGRNKLDDFYDDHNHSYTFHEKLNEVYQWRHGVFNRIRDKDKALPLTKDELNALQATPKEGGLLLDTRLVLTNINSP